MDTNNSKNVQNTPDNTKNHSAPRRKQIDDISEPSRLLDRILSEDLNRKQKISFENNESKRNYEQKKLFFVTRTAKLAIKKSLN